MTFDDVNGDKWTLKLTVGSLGDVKRLAGVDLGDALKNTTKLNDVLFGDPTTFVDVCYVLCVEQCQSRGLSDEDFGRRFDGETLERATNAFIEAVVDFFPRSAVARTVKKRLPELMARMDEEISREIEAKFDEAMKPTST